SGQSRNGIFPWLLNFSDRNNAGVSEGGIRDPAAREDLLQKQLLLKDQTFSVVKILTAAGHRGLRLSQLNGRLRSLVDLDFGVFIKSLGINQRLSLHSHVFAQADQVPIQPNHIGHGADQLLAKDFGSDSVLVFRYMNEAPIYSQAKSLEQGLD